MNITLIRASVAYNLGRGQHLIKKLKGGSRLLPPSQKPHKMRGKPKGKDTILKYRIKDSTILNIYGELAQIEDKEGVIWSLLELLNGEHTCRQLIKKPTGQYTHLSNEIIEEYLRQFVELGIVEDDTLTADDILDGYTIEPVESQH